MIGQLCLSVCVFSYKFLMSIENVESENNVYGEERLTVFSFSVTQILQLVGEAGIDPEPTD